MFTFEYFVNRPSFGWGNSLFGELILQLVITRPHLILDMDSKSSWEQLIKLVRPPISLISMRRPIIDWS